MERLRKEDRLRFLDAQLCPEWKSLHADVTPAPAVNLWLPTDPDELRSGFYFCNSLIQLMESVYLDLKLDQEHDHPDNRGWMNLFKHCAWSGMFRATFAISASNYGARFQMFCRRNLGLETGEVDVVPQSEGDKDQLNFHEVQLLGEFRKTNDGRSGPDQIELLQVVVRDISNPVPTDAGALRFTFGITVVQGSNVVLFRVQDHLRKMGLARAALRKMVHEQGISSFDKTRLVSYLADTTPPLGDRDPHKELKKELETGQPQDRGPSSPEVIQELVEMANRENLEGFEQLLRSVQREPRGTIRPQLRRMTQEESPDIDWRRFVNDVEPGRLEKILDGLNQTHPLSTRVWQELAAIMLTSVADPKEQSLYEELEPEQRLRHST
jgi:hypothetical protein